jgi:hypothetical protein
MEQNCSFNPNIKWEAIKPLVVPRAAFLLLINQMLSEVLPYIDLEQTKVLPSPLSWMCLDWANF